MCYMYYGAIVLWYYGMYYGTMYYSTKCYSTIV